MQTLLRFVLTILIGLPFASEVAIATDKNANKPASVKTTTGAQPPTTQQSAPPSPNQPAMPDAPHLRLLIYTTLIAINQANQSGNYSVLRDLAAPGFREANNPAKLSEIFADLRRRNLDLSPVIFLEPKLVRPPGLMENGMLRLTGFIPSAPEQVNFDLAFQLIEGRWQLFAIGVNTSPAAVAEGQSPPANTPNGKPSDVSFGNARLGAQGNSR